MQIAVQTGQMNVAAPTLSITSPTLPGGTQGQAYSFQCTATGGIPPYSWSATGLATGLSINAATGLVSGSPLFGSYNWSITCQDSSP